MKNLFHQLIKEFLLLFAAIILSLNLFSQDHQEKKLKIAVARMTHGHVVFILERLRNNSSDLELMGIYEPDEQLAADYSRKYNLNSSLFFKNLEEMLDKVKPEAVLAFGSIFEHLGVVEACAPRGIHVMVEKPLAVSMEHANKIRSLAGQYKIHVLTDFETSWYPSTAKSWQLVNDSNFVGDLRRVVIHDGHEGPKEIGCGPEFLAWLTDPVQNGGGAIIDFGCYGANLMTFLTKGQQPVSVTASLRQLKPEIYPAVDDDATVIVSYPSAECIIQASWNWPFGRKDMEIYGENGYIMADNRNDMRLRNRSTPYEISREITAEELDVFEDPFCYFIHVVRGWIAMEPWDPYSIENNIIVVKILDAARESAKSGKKVEF